MVEDAELGGRHVGVAHELLGERLARLELRGLLGRPKDAQLRLLKRIDHAMRQRLFRSHYGQPHVLFLGEADQAVEVVRFKRDVDAVRGGAGVAGSAEHALRARRLRQLPHQRVLATAFADN